MADCSLDIRVLSRLALDAGTMIFLAFPTTLSTVMIVIVTILESLLRLANVGVQLAIERDLPPRITFSRLAVPLVVNFE